MLLASCSGDDEPAPLNPDGKRTVTITVSATDEMQTRAISENEDTQIDRCLIQIMNGETTEVAATAMTPNGTNSYTYSATLDAGGSYTFLFWADNSTEGYTATDLTNITATTPVGIAYATTATWDGSTNSINANLQLVVSKVTLKSTTFVPAGTPVNLTIPQTYGGYDVEAAATTGSTAAYTHRCTVPAGGVTAGGEVCSFYVLTPTTSQTLTLNCGGGDITISGITLAPGKHLKLTGDIGSAATSDIDISADISDSWEGVDIPFGTTSEYTNATQPSATLQGTGTATDPWLITSAADFACFAGDIDYRAPSTHTRLMTDINIQASAWTPINNFRGTFDGNGHTISGTLNITVTDTEHNVGLFGEVYSATIRDLNVTADATVEGTIGDFTCYAGGIIGSANSSTLSRCTYAGNLSVSVAANYRICAGGIAGFASTSSTISYCTNTGTISTEGSTTELGSIHSGGIVGYSEYATLEDNAFTDGVPDTEAGLEL